MKFDVLIFEDKFNTKNPKTIFFFITLSSTVKRPTLGGIRLGSGRIYSQVDFEVWFQLSVGFSSANGGRVCGLE